VRTLLCAAAAVVLLGFATAAQARTVTLAYDAAFSHAQIVDKAPAGDSAGDRQVVSGTLREAGGRKVGTFSFTCVYVAIVDGDAHERCTGTGGTGDGRIAFRGPARKSDEDHAWTFTGTSGALKGARGTGAVHDPTQHDSIVVITAKLTGHGRLRDGVVPRPAANRAFMTHVTKDCDATRAAYSKLPPFPFADFDPLNPDPAQLQQVGQFFSGAGDARPPERTLVNRLKALGRPPVASSFWSPVVPAVRTLITSQGKQTTDALNSDVARFVADVRAADLLTEHESFVTRAFGVPRCDFSG
jgi:hypothetical protein